LKVIFFNRFSHSVTVHGVHSPSSDRRDIPVPHHGTAGLENPAYRAFVVPVNGYLILKEVWLGKEGILDV